MKITGGENKAVPPLIGNVQGGSMVVMYQTITEGEESTMNVAFVGRQYTLNYWTSAIMVDNMNQVPAFSDAPQVTVKVEPTENVDQPSVQTSVNGTSIKTHACLPPRRTKPGYIPGWVTGFSQVGIVLDDAVGRRFSQGAPISPTPSFQHHSILTLITLIGSQDLDARSETTKSIAEPTSATFSDSIKQEVEEKLVRTLEPQAGTENSENETKPNVAFSGEKVGDDNNTGKKVASEVSKGSADVPQHPAAPANIISQTFKQESDESSINNSSEVTADNRKATDNITKESSLLTSTLINGEQVSQNSSVEQLSPDMLVAKESQLSTNLITHFTKIESGMWLLVKQLVTALCKGASLVVLADPCQVAEYHIQVAAWTPMLLFQYLWGLRAFHPGEPGSIPGEVAPGFSYVGIVLDDTPCWQVFSEISCFYCLFIPALLHTYLTSPSSVLKISMLRATQISLLLSTLQRYKTGGEDDHEDSIDENEHEDDGEQIAKRIAKDWCGLPITVLIAVVIAVLIDGKILRALVPDVDVLNSAISLYSLAIPDTWGYGIRSHKLHISIALVFIQGEIMCASCLRDDVNPVFRPYLDKLQEPIFQHDICPNVDRATQYALHSASILLWPTISSDIGPIEHMWNTMGWHVTSSPAPAMTITQLLQEVLQAWDIVPQRHIQHLCDTDKTSTTKAVESSSEQPSGSAEVSMRDFLFGPDVDTSNMLGISGTEREELERTPHALVKKIKAVGSQNLLDDSPQNNAVQKTVHINQPKKTSAGKTKMHSCIACGMRICNLFGPSSRASFFIFSFGAIAERLARMPPTKANRVQSPTGSSDFCKWESCRMMLLVGGFPSHLHSGTAPYSLQSPSSALNTSLLTAVQISSLHFFSFVIFFSSLHQVPLHLPSF
ncbi:hypothetical protein PR048_009888 [Dryococelus australis]|uniref:Uncharacterized protein n=1 Tax=Dryococelus australis TaxID=614101 RepID=A0ABQ9I277_9NEOP|nr:hypothetical protein PR048_009888 [Dryococelus australis]